MTTIHSDSERTRTLSDVFTARESLDGAGVKLKRVFSFQVQSSGNQKGGSLDPFLLLDELVSDSTADYIGGFPAHPHRGFETVTYLLEGRVRHKDHLGNTGELMPGSVQWMTAARGIVHSEMPVQDEGRMHGFQLWINLPAAEKMNPPRYQEYLPQEIPEYPLEGGISIKVIAGEVELEGTTITGPVNGVSTQPLYLDVTLPPNTHFQLPVTEKHALLTYVFEGELYSTKDQLLTKGQMGEWIHGNVLGIGTHNQGARLLIMAAKPLREPVVQYGPFVMNTREEIEQAIVDYESGRLTGSVYIVGR